MYSVEIDARVFSVDFRKIDRSSQQRILKAIRKKLTTHPELYGRPLEVPLKNYWKLKVGSYRIIYEILKKEVKVRVILIGFRRNAEAYLNAAARLGLL